MLQLISKAMVIEPMTLVTARRIEVWPTTRIRETLLHPNPLARQAAFDHFALGYSPDPAVMPLVTEALNRFSRDDEGVIPFHIEQLRQTPEVFEWALAQAERTDRITAWNAANRLRLSSIIAATDLELLRAHRQRIMACPALLPAYQEKIEERLKLGELDEAAKWSLLEQDCHKAPADSSRLDELELLVQALAEHPCSWTRAQQFLEEQVDDERLGTFSRSAWVAAKLAGALRQPYAIPWLLQVLRSGQPTLLGVASESLKRIGPVALPKPLLHLLHESRGTERRALAEVLTALRSGRVAAACLELAGQEQDVAMRRLLLYGALINFAPDAIEPARQYILEYNDELRPLLVGVATAMDRSFPELSRWHHEEQRQAQLRSRLLDVPEPAAVETVPLPQGLPDPSQSVLAAPPEKLKATKTVGRNDPCPCGSGKKYKKCCLQ